MKIYCCGCSAYVTPRLTDGAEIYPHRKDLYELPFWRCDTCQNYVGCHHKTKNRTKPLGVIPTPEIKRARKYIHAVIDPLWQVHGHNRKKVYAMISERCGWKYHTAKIRSKDEAKEIYNIALDISKRLK